MDPLSREEIEHIKGLKLQEFLEISVLHQKDISYVFFAVLPKLLAIAEDHRILSQKTETEQPALTLGSQQVQAFHKVSKTEKQILQEMERYFQLFRSTHAQKDRILSGIEEPAVEPEVVPEAPIPWYTKLFRKITGK